jgi:hypothetical protein
MSEKQAPQSLSPVRKLLKSKGRECHGNAPGRFIGVAFMILAASLLMLFVSKQAPQQGDVIKGMVFAGVICYPIGKYFEKKS